MSDSGTESVSQLPETPDETPEVTEEPPAQVVGESTEGPLEEPVTEEASVPDFTTEVPEKGETAEEGPPVHPRTGTPADGPEGSLVSREVAEGEPLVDPSMAPPKVDQPLDEGASQGSCVEPSPQTGDE